MTDNDKYLAEELERRLCWYRDEASDEEFDAEAVDAICVMLQRLSPVEGPRMSRQEAYRNILKRVQEEDEEREAENFDGEAEGEGKILAGVWKTDGLDGAEDRKEPGNSAGTEKTEGLNASGKTDSAEGADEEGHIKRSGGRKSGFRLARKGYRAAVLFIAVFGAALLSLNMVTYAREDKSLFTMILERVGVLEIVKDTTVEEVVSSDDEIKTFYDTWADLDAGIKSRIVLPEYIPDGYTLYGINCYNYVNREKVLAYYYDEKNEHLLISITIWEDKKREYRESAIDEDEYTLVKEYSSENKLYYQYEDEYICMISMENSFYRISGNITLEEMVKVVEGISGA